MKYEEIQCGMRVVCNKGAGVVKSFDAKAPYLRSMLQGLAPEPPTLMATVFLDIERTVRIPIKNLSPEKSDQ